MQILHLLQKILFPIVLRHNILLIMRMYTESSVPQKKGFTLYRSLPKKSLCTFGAVGVDLKYTLTGTSPYAFSDLDCGWATDL